MQHLLYNIGQVLGISIIHSLWQGLIIYMLVRLYFIALPSTSATKKYYILFTALSAIAVWFGCTFFTEAKAYNWSVDTLSHPSSLPSDGSAYQAFDVTVPTQHVAANPFVTNKAWLYQTIQTYLPYISILYVIGLLINLGRLALDWKHIRVIKKGLAAAGLLQQQVDQFSRAMGIRKTVFSGYSPLVDGPCVIGYLKPILLLPVSIGTQLSTDEIEAILLHELAHIKHNDYLLNLIQQVIAVLLFLNPFAYLLSGMISNERENRCDDVVLQLTNKPLTYAQALVKLEERRQSDMQLALAATGAKYQLFARIQRIMKRNKPTVNIKHLVLALVIFIGSLGSISWLNPEIKNGRIVSKHGAQAIHRLTAMVKQMVAPAKPVTDQNKPDTAKRAVYIDTAKKAITSPAVSDTAQATIHEALLIEWQQLRRSMNDEREKINELPEAKEAKRLTDILDSARKSRYVVNAAYQQKLQSIRLLSDAFWKSPEQIKKQANYEMIKRHFLDAVANEPEVKLYEEQYQRQRDSLEQILKQKTGLTTRGLDTTNKEWQAWLTESMIKLDAIRMKQFSKPAIKAKYDSLQAAGKDLRSGPEYAEYEQKTKFSKEELPQATAGLEPYEAAVKAAVTKLRNTPLSKKYDADIKRSNEVVNKLKSIK